MIGFNPGLSTSGDVTVNEIFTEVRVPILADLPFVQKLTANGGYRSSDYDLEGVWVKAAKPEPPIPLPVDEVSVEVWREAEQ